MILMVSSHIYMFVFQNLSMCHTYIYSIGSTPKSIEYQFFRQFMKVPKLPRQFSLDMFGLWTGNIQLAGHVLFLAWTCPGLGLPAYTRALRTPLRTLGLFFFSSTPSLAVAKGTLGNFGSSPPYRFGFLEI
jgi:hypothetical protein